MKIQNTAVSTIKGVGAGVAEGMSAISPYGGAMANINNQLISQDFNTATSYNDALNKLGSNALYNSDLKWTKTDDNTREFYNTALANLYNSEEAQKNRDFQEYMSNTQHQRTMKDLEEAGINPLALMATGSYSSNSSPSGSTASAVGVARSHDGTGELIQGLGAVANTAIAGAKLGLAIKQYKDSFSLLNNKQSHELYKITQKNQLAKDLHLFKTARRRKNPYDEF